LAAGHKREMGQYEVLSITGFPGFTTGKMSTCFHMDGMSAFATKRFKSLVRYSIARIPRWVGCSKSIIELMRIKKVDMLIRSPIEIIVVLLKTIYHFQFPVNLFMNSKFFESML
jgi:hypothetical protein